MAQPSSAGLRRTRAYRWLAALPGLAMLGGVVVANQARPFVLGLPFLLFWILFWVLATAAVMALVYYLDEAASRRTTPGSAGAGVAPAARVAKGSGES